LSLVAKLKPHLEDLKVHKPVTELNGTERRLNQMTAIILNKNMSKEQKDKLLKTIVDESRVEKALKKKGIKL
jgi:hypothetical protein